MNLLHGLVRFGIWIVVDVWKHKPEIERRLAAFGRNLEHVVVTRIDSAAFDFFCALHEVIDEAFQLRAVWRADCYCSALLKLRHRQFEHLAGLHIRDLAKLLHQLGDVNESRETALQTIPASVRAQLHRSHGFAECSRP